MGKLADEERHADIHQEDAALANENRGMMSIIGKRSFYPNDKAREYIAQILDTGRVSYGPFSKQFESEFARLHDCRYAVLSNSGTSSLHVALQTLKEMHGWQDGDEIIVPALTFVATINVVLHNRLTPVLIDVDPLYYGIDHALIERAITPRTRAIVPVHTFGQPAEMIAIMDIARRYNLAVVEDSCECMLVGHGVGFQRVGSFGDIGCFSTYMSHIITTGVGGMTVTSNPDYARRLRSLVNHGMVSDTLDGFEFDPARDFVFESIGHSFRVTEFEAALGLSQLDSLGETIKKRQANASYLTRGLSRWTQYLQLPSIRPDTEHAFMMYPIVCFSGEDRNALRVFLRERGMGTRLMLPLTNQPCYQGLFREADYPVAQWINQSGFYIGCHEHLTTDELDYIAATIADYFNGRTRTQEPISSVAIPA